jgi:hypothetical protein
MGIGTHDPSNQAAKTYALDRAATGTGSSMITSTLILLEHQTALLTCTTNYNRLSPDIS